MVQRSWTALPADTPSRRRLASQETLGGESHSRIALVRAPVQGGIVPLSFQSRRVGDITVVTCSGRIVAGAEATALQQHLTDLLHHDPYLILHLGAVDFIDSSGVGLLVRFFSRTQQAGGNLKLCDVSP